MGGFFLLFLQEKKYLIKYNNMYSENKIFYFIRYFQKQFQKK